MQPKVSKMKSTPQIVGHNQAEETNLITSVTTINRKIFQPDYLIMKHHHRRQIFKESGKSGISIKLYRLLPSSNPA